MSEEADRIAREALTNEIQRLHKLLEEKGHDLEHAWSVERTLRAALREEHDRNQELRNERETLHIKLQQATDDLEIARDLINDSEDAKKFRRAQDHLKKYREMIRNVIDAVDDFREEGEE